MPHEMNSVLIKGHYGAGNIGDDAILHAIASSLQCLSFRVSAFTYGPVHRTEGVSVIQLPSCRLGKGLAFVRGLGSASVLVFGGGAQINLNSREHLKYMRRQVEIANLIRRKVWFLHVGIDGTPTKIAQGELKRIIQASEVFSVRDRCSFALSQSIVPGRAVLTADAAILLNPKHRLDCAQRGLCLIPASCGGYEVPMALQIARWCESTGTPMILACTSFVDIPLQKILYSVIRAESRAQVYLRPFVPDPLEFVAQLASSKLVVTMRLHGGIFAGILGLPVLVGGNTAHITKALAMIGYSNDIASDTPELLARNLDGFLCSPGVLAPNLERMAEARMLARNLYERIRVNRLTGFMPGE